MTLENKNEEVKSFIVSWKGISLEDGAYYRIKQQGSRNEHMVFLDIDVAIGSCIEGRVGVDEDGERVVIIDTIMGKRQIPLNVL